MSEPGADPDLARRRAARLTLGELLRRGAVRAPDAPALALGDQTRSYGELDRRADRVAGALRERGVAGGDRVAVWMHNSIEMVEALFAIQKLGAAAVPLNFRLGSEEARFILDDAGAVGIVADQELLDRVAGRLQIGWTLAVASGDPGSSYEEAIRTEAGPAPDALVDEGAPAFVMYTSGTTGRPKGAVLTHRNLMANTWNWGAEVGIGRDDVYTAGLPLFHIGGLVGLYPFLHLGSLVVLQPSGAFDPQAALDLQERRGATVCAYVPAQWRLIVEQQRARTQLRGARRSIWGASPAGRQLLEAMAETLPPDSVVSTFGQTEVTANATFLAPRDSLRKLGSVGRPVATMEHRVVDDDDRDVVPGEVGEIVYRGPTVMPGYHDRRRRERGCVQRRLVSQRRPRTPGRGRLHLRNRAEGRHDPQRR